MEGYRADSYGEAFADVYDEWYSGLSDAADVVELLTDLVPATHGGDRARLLELGVGTGRLAIPAAAAGFQVTGLDSSAAMLAALADADPQRSVETVHGDMVDDLPAGPFDAVLVAYNTLFNLETTARQQALFDDVAARLRGTGCFVVEAFVPEDRPAGSDFSVRSISADTVVLSASIHDQHRQRAHGQLIELSETGGVRLRPWSICYATPAQLDDMASKAGMALDARYADAVRARFDGGSRQHVSVYRLVR